MAILNFNAREVAPSSGFDPLPAGWYNAKMIESELKPGAKHTPENPVEMLAGQFEIIDGQFAGRRIFFNFNLKNPNPVATKIGYEQLSAFAWCVGIPDLTDSQMAHNVPLQIKLKVKPATEGYDAGNDISGFRTADGRDAKDVIAASGGAAQAPAAPGAPTAPQAPAAPGAPAAAHDPMAAAVADGWIVHPSAPGYLYKGQEVKADAEVAAMYPAPAAPAVPAAPAAPPAAPAAPAAPVAAGGPATPPWAAPKA